MCLRRGGQWEGRGSSIVANLVLVFKVFGFLGGVFFGGHFVLEGGARWTRRGGVNAESGHP